MKKFNLTLLFSLLAISLFAQDMEPQSQFAKDYLSIWKVTTKNAIDIAEAMPEDLYDYKPNDSSKTFADQIGHIAMTTLYLSKGFVNTEWGKYDDGSMAGKSKDEVVALLKANLEESTKLIAGMSEEASTETIKAFGGKMVKRYVALLFIQDHLTNHKAKANLYIRMNDIKPPAYAFFN
ncbi:MAG: DinB family protein [Cyclobacteriaceae bacterium]